MALDNKAGKKFGKVAMGKVQQALPSTDANVTAVSNRVSVLEGYTLHSRITALEALVDSLTTHKHDYDDGGVAEVTGLPRQ